MELSFPSAASMKSLLPPNKAVTADPSELGICNWLRLEPLGCDKSPSSSSRSSAYLPENWEVDSDPRRALLRVRIEGRLALVMFEPEGLGAVNVGMSWWRSGNYVRWSEI